MNPIQNSGSSSIDLALRDIHLPDSIFWWPIAPGWWVLLFLFVVIALSIFIYKNIWYVRKLNNNIKLECTQYYLDFNINGDRQFFIQQLSIFLRRVSLYLFSENNVANLQGIEWLEFLDSKLPLDNKNQSGQSAQNSFKTGVGKIFLSGPYQENIIEDVIPAYKLVEKWLNYNLKNKYRFL